MRIVLLAALLLLWNPAIGKAEADVRRLALLIANSAYQGDFSALANPRNDVDLVAAALKDIGFKAADIRIIEDKDKIRIQTEIEDHAARLAAAGPKAVGFFYYAGHGMSAGADRANYMIPVDVARNDRELHLRSVPVTFLIDTLIAQAPQALHLVVIDACRDGVKTDRVRGARPLGFTAVPQREGVLIAFSTAPGKTALDGSGRNGPYAESLVHHMRRAGARAAIVFEDTKFDVYRKTEGQQFPWWTSRFTEPLFLNGGSRPGFADPRPSLPTVAAVYATINERNDRQARQAFARRYADTIFASHARGVLATKKTLSYRRIKDRPDGASPPPKPVERQRKPEYRFPTAGSDDKAKTRKPALPGGPLAPTRLPNRADIGDWFVIAGSFDHDAETWAVVRVGELRKAGFDAYAINTDNYHNLRSGLWTVVLGPFNKQKARAEQARVRDVVPDAYIKRGEQLN